MEMTYELAKNFVQAASKAKVKSHTVIRMNGDDLAALTAPENNLTVFYGTIYGLSWEGRAGSFAYKNDFGYDKMEYLASGFCNDGRYGVINAGHVLFNSSAGVTATDFLGLVWFVGYRFELEYLFGQDMLEGLDFAADVDAADNWDETNGAWTHTAGETEALIINTDALTEGEVYEVTAKVIRRTAGDVTVGLAGTNASSVIDEDGIYTYQIFAGSGGNIVTLTPSSDFDGTIEVAPTLRKRIDAN